MIENWQEECQELDISIKDGRLILSQNEATPEISFEEQLGCLNKKWSEMVSNVENRKVEAEKIAKNWWDITKSKARMLKWMEKKENDLNRDEINKGGLANAENAEKKLKVCLSKFCGKSSYRVVFSSLINDD